MEIIEKALKEGRTTLSEYESKQVLASYGIPVTKELVVDNVPDLINATKEIGYPLVLKGCSSGIAHKTEKGLIKVDIRNEEEAKAAFEEITANIGAEDAVLVQEMVKGQRELVIGLTRDPQFGPCVMFGLGGNIYRNPEGYIVPGRASRRKGCLGDDEGYKKGTKS